MQALLYPFIHRWTSRLSPEQRQYCFNLVTTCHPPPRHRKHLREGDRKKELELGGGVGAPECYLVGVARHLDSWTLRASQVCLPEETYARLGPSRSHPRGGRRSGGSTLP